MRNRNRFNRELRRGRYILGEEKKKRGRPVTGEAKTKQIHIRTTDNTYEMLSEICESHGVSKSEMFEKMVRTQYNLTKDGYNF